jgi:glycosyltransferase involved in cell wall biosynthesis
VLGRTLESVRAQQLPPGRLISAMPKILYFATEDWFFASHFLPMARAAREAGFEVVVAARLGGKAQQIIDEGIRLLPLGGERRSLSPIGGLRDFLGALAVVRSEAPDIVHCIALRPVVLGGVAAKLAHVKGLVVAPTGLGQLWVDDDFMIRVVRSLIRVLVGSWLRGGGTRYLFENGEDPREFGLEPTDRDVAIVGGAGIDQKDFPFVAEPPAPPVKVALVSRMIAPKGIAEVVEATRRARAHAPIELHLFGDSDPTDRRSISELRLRRWSQEPGIYWHGRTDDVAGVWRTHHIAILLSYREGLPRTLVEAAAAGRPIVASDCTGCREVVRDGEEGFLIAPGDIDAAARVLVKLAEDPALRGRLGAAANARFRERFTEAAVRTAVGNLYRQTFRAPPRC